MCNSVIYLLLIFIALEGCPCSLTAQNNEPYNSKIEKLTKLEGLKVKCMLKDRQGFMWFGTETGLYRYDGYSTELVNNTSRSPVRLSSDLVLSLYEDRQNNLWIGTSNGLQKLSADRTSITTYLASPPDTAKRRKAIYAIAEMQDGSLWCSSEDGSLYRADSKKPFVLIPGTAVSDNRTTPGFLSNITEDESHHVWVADNLYGFRKFSLSGQILHVFPVEGPASAIACFAGQSALFYANRQNVYAYSAEQNGFAALAKNELSGVLNSPIRHVFQDKKGYQWLVFGSQLIRFRPESGRMDDFTPMFMNSGAPFFQIDCIYEEPDGKLWFGSYFGVYRLNEQANLFQHISLPQAMNPSSYFSTRGIAELPGGNLFFGSYSGFFHYSKKTGQFKEYRMRQGDKWVNPLARSLVFDTTGNLWLATEGNGLLNFNTATAPFTFHPLTTKPGTQDQASSLSSYNYSLLKDKEGKFWIGGYDNLYELDPGNGRLQPFTWGAEKKSLPPLKVMVTCQGRDGSIWIGTDNGVYRIQKGKGVIAHYASSASGDKSAPGLTHNYINCMYEDRNGWWWLGTKGGGINVLDPASGRLQRVYTTQHGLADDIVCAILPGAGNELWISTYNGLSRLNPQNGTFHNFYTKDGLPTNEFNQGSALAGSDSSLYFGSMNGIVFFHPGKLRAVIKEPEVMLTKLVQHNGRENRTEENALAVQTIQEIRLHHKDQVFSVYFTLKDFSENTGLNAQFAYKLDGITTEWQNTGAVNYIQFAGLPSGDYVLRVKGMGIDGIWGKKELIIPVSIAAPFYATPAAYIFYALAVLVAIIMIYRFQLSRIRLKNKLQLEYLQKEKLQELDQIKSLFFTHVTHEFRTPLTLIISPLEQLIGKHQLPAPDVLRQQHGIIHRNAQRLLRLINQLLDSAKIEAGGMTSTLSQGNVVLFISHLIESFRLQAEEEGVHLQFEPADDRQEYLFDAEKLEKIMFNLLSNALKFTASEGSVVVTLTWEAFEKRKILLQIKVSDTGIGIPVSQLPFVFDRFYQVDNPLTKTLDGSGVGLFLVRELTQLLNGTIEAESREGHGTTFTVRLPLQIAGDGMSGTPAAAMPVINTMKGEINMVPQSSPEAPLVLVVEDHEDLRNFIASGLTATYRIQTARNGSEGWQLVQQELPDLVIADVNMPEMDGFTLSRYIRDTPLTTHIAIILLTARASSGSRLEGLSTGANDYVTKPFHLDELRLRIANLLGFQQKLRLHWQQQFSVLPAQEVSPAISDEPVIQDPFLLQVNAVLARELSNSEFSVDQLAREMTVSTRTLHRKVSALTGMNSSELIRSYRLNKAAILLKQGSAVVDAAYATGFESLSYFSKCFKSQFSVTPSEYSVS